MKPPVALPAADRIEDRRRRTRLLGNGLPPFDVWWSLHRRKVTDTDVLKAVRASAVWRGGDGWDLARIGARYSRWARYPRLLMRALIAEGGNARRRYGRGLLSQTIDMLRVAVVNGLTPDDYYTAALARYRGGSEIFDYLPFILIRDAAFLMSGDDPRSASHPVRDKLAFEATCRKHGLRVVSTFAVASDTEILTPDLDKYPGPLPDRNFIVKPRIGGQGRGIEAWHSDGSGRFSNPEAGQLSSPDLAARVSSLSRAHRSEMLLQDKLVNNPALRPIAGSALASTRIVTMFNEHGEPEIVDAYYRTSIRPDSAVDNFHSGGLLFPIDRSSGVLGPGIGDRPFSPGLIAQHPQTGVRVAGFKHPAWSAMADLALRLHRLFPDLVMPGWDIGFDGDGPVLIEGNRVSGVSMNYQPLLGGICGTRMLSLLAYHARQWLEHNEPDRSRLRKL